jgi:prefoldin alpha subunit
MRRDYDFMSEEKGSKETEKSGRSNVEGMLQEKVLAFKSLEGRMNALVRQQNAFAQRLLEIQGTIDSIGEIEKGQKEILFPLGSAAFMEGSVSAKEKIIVEVGAGVALEKTTDEGKKILETRKTELERAMATIQEEVKAITTMMQQIEAETQTILAKAQQQEQKFRVVSG